MTQTESAAGRKLRPSSFTGSRLKIANPGPIALSSLLFLICVGTGIAQVPPGTPPFGSFTGPPDIINEGNLNVHFNFPIVSKAGRGLPFSYALAYDSSFWTPLIKASWYPPGNWGWKFQSGVVGDYNYTQTQVCCPGQTCNPNTGSGTYYNSYSNWTFEDPSGTSHAMPMSLSVNDSKTSCPYATGIWSTTATAIDSSGWTMTFDALPEATLAYDVAGNTYNFSSVTDPNGNVIAENWTGVSLSFLDTLGMTALSFSGSGTPSSPLVFQYTAAGNVSEQVTMKYQALNIRTNFGCVSPRVQDYSQSNVSMVTEIDLPDFNTYPNHKYTFTYEATPGYPGYYTGRLASVTLPTGGQISYAYQGPNNGINCYDGSVPQLQRTVSGPGITTGVWTYARSNISGSEWQTTVTDPLNNQTIIYFNGPPPSREALDIYETQRLVYQGSSSSGTLLEQIDTCYNGATIPCLTTSWGLNIANRTVQTTMPGLSGTSKVYTAYNGWNLPTEVDEYDWGATSPSRKTVTTYAWPSEYIDNRPSTVQVYNAGGTLVAQRSYTYDSAGNMKTASYTGQNMGTLTRSYSYGSYGLLSSMTDYNTAVTTYPSYYSCNGQPAYLATTNLPVNNLSTSATWDCYAGLVTSVAGLNGKTTSYAYNDPYSRLTSVTDPSGAVTNITYTPATSESTLNFNSGASTVDVLTTVDALGRPFLTQRKQNPSSNMYDTVETFYDDAGRVIGVSSPCSAPAGGTCSGGTTISPDALGRPTSITDAGGGTVSFSYNANDVLRTVGPAPPSESTKSWQYEYDGLGRLSSVCEITSATGSASCGQNHAATGYLTKYTYDALDDLTGVTQNAQSGTTQTRTYAYDGLRRMTSQANPEANNSAYSYTYDTDSTCVTIINNGGDLVKRVDAVGNVTCYAHDGIHRLTGVTYPSGSYASVTPSKTFVYDSATVNGQTMQNTGGLLAEAYTGSKATDLGFSYSARGEVSDTYESTPHSNGYYHSSAPYYWENGLIKTLAGPGIPTLTYYPEGEGRASWVTASSGQNPVPSNTPTSYNIFGKPNGVNFGSNDNDSFGYDSSTGRMASYAFSVNSSQVQTGTLTWNANGTLQKLVITGNTGQTCVYGYDDLARIASANCGTVWNETFSFSGGGQTTGAFGNLSKTAISGAQNFLPNYSMATNRMTSLGSQTPTYDANGALTFDTYHSYTWDSEGHAVTVDTMGLTYDALGRMVEQNRSGAYTQIVYGPPGNKLALMNGQTLSKAFVGLPGGATAVYTSSGLSYYRHSDWLGSSRLDSNSSRAVTYQVAYAPYGEPYDESGTTDRNFTGQNQDTVGDMYDFLYREYHEIQGRWILPDPAGLAAVNPTNPQSWNAYAYVVNNPTTLIDPKGLYLHSPGEAWGDYGCTIDGLAVDCAEAAMQAAAGAIAACPNNVCSGFATNSSGQVAFFQFQPAINGPNNWVQLTPWTSSYLSPEQYLNALNAQLAAVIAAMEEANVDAATIRKFINHVSNNYNHASLVGGNFEFPYGNINFGLTCPGKRCDEGSFGTLDFSHNNGTLHLDTADPLTDVLGAFMHGFVDLFLGNYWYQVIPRPWGL